MKKLLASALFAFLVVGGAVATDASRLDASRMTCSKTGAQVEACCCIERDGVLVCTLTGEAVSSCCCEAAN